jgi:hypothetical protein
MQEKLMFIDVFNGVTGEHTQREMTPEEVAEREALNTDSPNLPDVE